MDSVERFLRKEEKMIDKTLWLKIEDSKKREEVQEFILSLGKEGLLGEIKVTLYAEKERAKCVLSHIYDISEQAIPVLMEKYGDKNVRLKETEVGSSNTYNFKPELNFLERIADALEGIDRSLANMDQSLELMSDILSDSQVKNPYGSSISVTGAINVIE